MNHTKPHADTLTSLIHAAVMAPSSLHTQPWLFRPDGEVIDLLADRTRALPVNRPGYAHLLLRIGTPMRDLPTAPRRPLAEVMVTA
jgi:hypothetical protein